MNHGLRHQLKFNQFQLQRVFGFRIICVLSLSREAAEKDFCPSLGLVREGKNNRNE